MKITAVTVSKKRTIDVGFQPYIDYIQNRFKTLNVQPNQIPFGMKENSVNEMFLSMTAEVNDEEETIEEAIDQMVEIIDKSLDMYLGKRQAGSDPEYFEVGESTLQEDRW